MDAGTEGAAPERGTRLAGGGRESGDMLYLAGTWKVGRAGVLLSAFATAASGLVLDWRWRADSPDGTRACRGAVVAEGVVCEARECPEVVEVYVRLGRAAADLVGDVLLPSVLLLLAGVAFVGDGGRAVPLKGFGIVSDLTGLMLLEKRLGFFVGLVSPREEVRTHVSGAPFVGDTLR